MAAPVAKVRVATISVAKSSSALSQPHQRLHLGQRCFEIVIDHDSIKFLLGFELLASASQAALNGILRIGSAPTDPALQFFKAGGSQKI